MLESYVPVLIFVLIVLGLIGALVTLSFVLGPTKPHKRKLAPYDIDLILNRALVYIPLTAILAGCYTAGVALFQRLFTAVTGDKSDGAVVITTLASTGA